VRPGRSAADEAAEGKAGHNKGLRQFSRQVWMKVMEKQKTNYNEVADELVQEFREEAAQVRRPRSLRALGRADLERSPSPSPRPP